jgi:hypothetical protein
MVAGYLQSRRERGVDVVLANIRAGVDEHVRVGVNDVSATSNVTTQDFIKFWGKFFAFVLLEMIGNSQGIKTF